MQSESNGVWEKNAETARLPIVWAGGEAWQLQPTWPWPEPRSPADPTCFHSDGFPENTFFSKTFYPSCFFGSNQRKLWPSSNSQNPSGANILPGFLLACSAQSSLRESREGGLWRFAGVPRAGKDSWAPIHRAPSRNLLLGSLHGLREEEEAEAGRVGVWGM